jgi:hypothetical protein
MRALAAIASMLLAGSCVAAPVYKVVGPDGKVSFTDQPPATANKDKPLKGTGTADLGEAADDGATSNEATKAAVRVYANQVVVETGFRFCHNEVPGTSDPVRMARQGWMDRNGALLDKKNRVLRDTIGLAAMNKLAEETERDNERILNMLRGAPMAEKRKWCEAAPQNFKSAKLDPSLSPALVRLITDFKLKPGP